MSLREQTYIPFHGSATLRTRPSVCLASLSWRSGLPGHGSCLLSHFNSVYLSKLLSSWWGVPYLLAAMSQPCIRVPHVLPCTKQKPPLPLGSAVTCLISCYSLISPLLSLCQIKAGGCSGICLGFPACRCEEVGASAAHHLSVLRKEMSCRKCPPCRRSTAVGLVQLLSTNIKQAAFCRQHKLVMKPHLVAT